jgi:hypothetical protein
MSGYNLGYFRDVNDRGEAKPNYGKWGALYVILVNPDTGLPYTASGGGGGGGGDASAANQLAVIGSKTGGTAAASSQLTGAVFTSTALNLATTQQAALQADFRGNLKVRLHGTSAVAADGMANSIAAISGEGDPTGGSRLFPVAGYLFNGTNWDRPRGNTKGMQVIPAPVVSTDRSATISTTNTVLMAANAARSGFGIVNDTANDVYVRFGVAATAAVGGGNIKVRANGGSFISEGLTVEAGSINIIAAASGTAITAWEY